MQGIVAGLNAARRAQSLSPITLSRDSSYLGTLLDDLVTKVPAAALHPMPSAHSCSWLLHALHGLCPACCLP